MKTRRGFLKGLLAASAVTLGKYLSPTRGEEAVREAMDDVADLSDPFWCYQGRFTRHPENDSVFYYINVKSGDAMTFSYTTGERPGTVTYHESGETVRLSGIGENA